MIFGIDIPVVVSLVTAMGALVMGFLAHKRGRKEIDTNSLDAHLTNLREMYKELVDDYRLEIERLKREVTRLEKAVQQSNSRIRELETREDELNERAKKLNTMLELAQTELDKLKGLS